jgi:prolipoprotein diacylglyceryltransferase
MGNFFNSEIVGTPTSGWWAVVFDRVNPIPRHPVQLYEALAYLLIFGVLLWAYTRAHGEARDGRSLGLFLALVFSARFVLEFAKTPQAEYEAGFVLTVGQLLSVPFIVIGAILILRARRPARPPHP